jgi:solute carrier family 25 protein 38
MSPAAKVSSRNQTYDVYLVPEPHIEMPLNGTSGGFEHWKDIVAKLNKAMPEFEARGQLRKVEQLKLEVSKTLLRAQQYEDAFLTLRPLWESMSWRREGWWNLASEVVWTLHECALRVQDRETYVLTEWELYSPGKQTPTYAVFIACLDSVTNIFLVFGAKSRYKHDLVKCLDIFPVDEALTSKPSISFNTRMFESCCMST